MGARHTCDWRPPSIHRIPCIWRRSQSTVGEPAQWQQIHVPMALDRGATARAEWPPSTGNIDTAVCQAEVILGRFLQPERFRIVVVQDSLDESLAAMRGALAQLGVDLGVVPELGVESGS